MTAAFTSAEINAGRKLFAGDWQFLWAASSLDTLPKMAGIEIAFAGRSNVGKSSLINAVTGRKSLARTSHTPGRTQELIYFSNDGPMRLVDMPGYGYAEAPKQKVEEWTALIHSYLRGRANLARVYVLIDARHGLKDSDRPALDALGEAAVSHQIVLTKADQLKDKDLQDRLAAIGAVISRRGAAFPDILVTSALKGQGIPELRAAVARLVSERKR
jgi:GTP-binding protein